jgi:hypothetical protein
MGTRLTPDVKKQRATERLAFLLQRVEEKEEYLRNPSAKFRHQNERGLSSRKGAVETHIANCLLDKSLTPKEAVREVGDRIELLPEEEDRFSNKRNISSFLPALKEAAAHAEGFKRFKAKHIPPIDLKK